MNFLCPLNNPHHSSSCPTQYFTFLPGFLPSQNTRSFQQPLNDPNCGPPTCPIVPLLPTLSPHRKLQCSYRPLSFLQTPVLPQTSLSAPRPPYNPHSPGLTPGHLTVSPYLFVDTHLTAQAPPCPRTPRQSRPWEWPLRFRPWPPLALLQPCPSSAPAPTLDPRRPPRAAV